MSIPFLYKISLSYILKFYQWGLPGLIGWIKRKNKERREKRAFLRNAHYSKSTIPERGITIIAPLTEKSALSKTMRDFIRELDEAGIKRQTYNLSKTIDIPEIDACGIVTNPNEFQLSRYSAVIDLYSSPYPNSIGLKHGRIAFWEAESGIIEVYPELHHCGGLIGMSDFNANYFKKEFPNLSVWKILYPFRFSPPQLTDKVTVRTKYGIANNDFVVFYNFDYGSGIERKNPEGVIRAFAKAFKGTKNTKLVFKTKSAGKWQEDYEHVMHLIDKHDIRDQFISIDVFISEADLYGLTNACDVYLSLHRGEGFGLGIAEAMSLGKPVVVTDYSSTTEFCNSDNSIPIRYKLIPLTKEQRKFPYFARIKEWAEPNIDDAANALIKLRNDPKFAHQLGERAAASLRKQFSIENFKASVNAFLDS